MDVLLCSVLYFVIIYIICVFFVSLRLFYCMSWQLSFYLNGWASKIALEQQQQQQQRKKEVKENNLISTTLEEQEEEEEAEAEAQD